MATAYPSGIDDFTNPLATDALDSVTVPHANQHADANDAIEAIETVLGVDPNGAEATVSARIGALESTVDTATTGLTDRVDALETTVDTATTGLVDRVGALETTVDTATTGLVDRVDAIETGLGDPIGSGLSLTLDQIAGEASDELVAGTDPGDVDDSAVIGYVKIAVNGTDVAFPVYAIVTA